MCHFSSMPKIMDMVFRCFQIIMAKPAGGPGRRDQPAGMDED